MVHVRGNMTVFAGNLCMTQKSRTSHAFCLCRPIMDNAEIQDIAKLMWEAPFGVLSHDLEESADAPKYVTMLKQQV